MSNNYVNLEDRKKIDFCFFRATICKALSFKKSSVRHTPCAVDMTTTALPPQYPPSPAPLLHIIVAHPTPRRRPDRSAVAASGLRTLPIKFAGGLRAPERVSGLGEPIRARRLEARDARRTTPSSPVKPVCPLQAIGAVEASNGVSLTRSIERHTVFTAKTAHSLITLAPPPAPPSHQTASP